MTNQTTTNRNTFAPYNDKCVFEFNATFPLPPYINPDIQQDVLEPLDVFVLPEKAGFFRRVAYYGYDCGYVTNITQSYREDGDACEWDIQYLNLDSYFGCLENKEYYRSHFSSDCELLGFAVFAHWSYTDFDQFYAYLEDTRDLLPDYDDFRDLPF